MRNNLDQENHADLLNSILSTWQIASRNQIIINGGSCIALLAFIGGIYINNEMLARQLSCPLLCFGAGVLSGALCSWFRVKSQELIYWEKDKKKAKWFALFSNIAGNISYAMFFLGGIVVVGLIGWGG